MRRFLCIQTGNPRMDERQFAKFPVSEKKIKIEGVAGGAATPSPLFALLRKWSERWEWKIFPDFSFNET
jgi:hypothetical protein